MKKLLLLVLVSPVMHAMELVPVSSNAKLLTDYKNMYLEDQDASHRIDKHNMNPLLREVIQRQAMGKFKDAGYIRATKMSDGKYALAAHVRGEGGFLLTGVVVYQGCRVLGYTGLVLGSITTVATATVAGGPVGFFTAVGGVIAASGPTAAAIESSSLAIGTAASFIPLLP